jgi:hypothetical protein
MASGSTDQPAREPSARAPRDGLQHSGGPPPRGEERIGPLAILRTRKADGRALLLYSRVEHDASDAADEPA